MTGCSLFTNSSNPNSIYFGPKGSASINLYEVNGKLDGWVGTAGGTHLSSASTINKCADTSCSTSSALTPTSGDAQLPDPYANLSVPSPSGCLTPPAADQCKSKKTVIPGWCLTAGNTTLSPGTCCGGIAVSGNSNVTLQSGIYVLATTSQNETGLNMSNGTTLTGSDVTLVFTSADGSYPPAGSDMMDLANGTTTTLSAPSTGPTAGFVILGDRSMPLGTSGQSSSTPTGAQFVVENGAVASLDGAVYMPNGAFSFEGNGGATTPCTQIIANVIDLNNSGNLNVNCGVNNGGGAPDTLIGAIPLLVE